MQYRNIGKSNVSVSEVSLGCWTMGGLSWVEGNASSWANVDEAEIMAGIKVALDAGVNHFDNADAYGNGRAERLLAKVLNNLGVASESVVIATKVGHVRGTAAHAYEPKHIRHQCEQSLINLGRDYLDVYYFHHGDFGPHLQEAAAVMNDLVKEGLVRAKGQSAYSLEDFQQAVPVVQPDVLQSWAHALDDQFIRKDSGLQSLMNQYGCTFVAFSPLAQGCLLDKFDPSQPPTFEAGDHRQGSAVFGAEAIGQLKPKLQLLKERFGETIEDLSAVAQRYILNHANVACTIPGFRNERQVLCNLSAISRSLSVEDMAFIAQVLQ